jgi:hypothetical protein
MITVICNLIESHSSNMSYFILTAANTSNELAKVTTLLLSAVKE